MPKNPFPHQLIPPPNPFPNWLGSGKDSLVYLAWGARDYHQFPIPIHSNPGWTYWILLQGDAVVEISGEHHEFNAGNGFYCGPECAFGFPKQPASDVRVAYENGYRHANDFSRAFRKHFGHPPSQQQPPST